MTVRKGLATEAATTSRRPAADPREDTVDIFLNAAEKLFADNGFDGTSVRAIAAESGVNLGALHYYWGSKEALIRAVLERRLRPILAERKRRYAKLLADAGDGPPDIHALLLAQMEPALAVPGATQEQRQRFRRLYGQALADRSATVRAIVDDIYDESSAIFVGALRRCCSHLNDQEFFWRMGGILGTLLYAQLDNGRVTRLSGGKFQGNDIEAGLRELVPFLAAGMMVPTAAGESRKPRSAKTSRAA